MGSSTDSFWLEMEAKRIRASNLRAHESRSCGAEFDGEAPNAPREVKRRGPLAGLLAVLALALVPGAGSGDSTSVPLANGCPRSSLEGGLVLSSGLGSTRSETAVVTQGEGATLSGYLRGEGAGVAGATVCVFARVFSEEDSQLLGIALTDQNGRYEFPLAPGPSRSLTAVYRTAQGQLSAATLLQTRAVPVLRLGSSTIFNKHYAHFSGQIPGPDNDGVIVVLQVKRGHGWLVFRRYSTRSGGKFTMRYLIQRTFSPTIYQFRAQVLGGPAYPYLPGNSEVKELRVLP